MITGSMRRTFVEPVQQGEIIPPQYFLLSETQSQVFIPKDRHLNAGRVLGSGLKPIFKLKEV